MIDTNYFGRFKVLETSENAVGFKKGTINELMSTSNAEIAEFERISLVSSLEPTHKVSDRRFLVDSGVLNSRDQKNWRVYQLLSAKPGPDPIRNFLQRFFYTLELTHRESKKGHVTNLLV